MLSISNLSRLMSPSDCSHINILNDSFRSGGDWITAQFIVAKLAAAAQSAKGCGDPTEESAVAVARAGALMQNYAPGNHGPRQTGELQGKQGREAESGSTKPKVGTRKEMLPGEDLGK